MLSINWLRVGTGIFAGAFLCFVCYGAYHYYFDKPIPVVNNYKVESGGVIKQENPIKPKDRRLFTGISGNNKEVLLTLGWLW